MTASYRPVGTLDVATALAPSTGPWNSRLAAHLLRRAGFGGSPADVARLAAMRMPDAVDALMHVPEVSALPAAPADLAPDRPPPGAALATPPDPATLAAQRRVYMTARGQNRIALQSWFLDRMIASPAPLQEKMTLFWHGHFTSAYQKGVSAQELAGQNALFRRFALGNIAELALRVAQDPAMLRYLDNAQNVKAHPNENFARELLELYTLGIGNYTESDVRESARAFTGWTIDRATGAFTMNARRHDDGMKTFLGQSGNFDGTAILAIIFQKPAAARWFAAKLLNFFVYSDPEPELIDAVAGLLVKNRFELAPVLAVLFRSNVFYSARAYRALVKSPVEFVVGAYQLFGIAQSDRVALGALARMGQQLFLPPNVKGWDGGVAWLNSGTLLTRENFASSLTGQMNGTPWIAAAAQAAGSEAAARMVTETILLGDVAPSALANLAAYLDGGGATELGRLSPENAAGRVRGAAYLTMAMPAYQLA
jgi:uncharacterized protein (DUF1800 family)